jgi:hypothetical protein
MLLGGNGTVIEVSARNIDVFHSGRAEGIDSEARFDPAD